MTDTNQELASFLDSHPEVTHLDVLIIDLCGNAIGKRLPASSMGSVFRQGSPVCGAMQLVDVMGNTDDPMGYGFSDGDPDAFAVAIQGAGIVRIPRLGRQCAVVVRTAAGAKKSAAAFRIAGIETEARGGARVLPARRETR
jgi:glutamine synthetase